MTDGKKKGRKKFWFGPFFSVEEIERIMKSIMQEAYRKNEEYRPRLFVFSVKSGSDGKPRIRRLGSVGKRGSEPQVVYQGEPLVDVLDNEGEVVVVAELPSVNKEDIDLSGAREVLRISVDNPQHHYFKEVNMPTKVDFKRAKASYKNRVLEVTLPKA